MRNHLIFLSSLLLCIFTLCCMQDLYAGSMINSHSLINKTTSTVLVCFYEGYPVNKLHTKVLQPGKTLEVKSTVEQYSKFYLVTVTKNNGNRYEEETVKQVFSFDDYVDVLSEKEDGLVLNDTLFSNWEKI